MVNAKYVIIGVPERMELINAMKKQSPNAEFFCDPIRNKNCLSRLLKVLSKVDKSKYTHIVVMQDDLELCNDFEHIITQICESLPDSIFSAFNSRLRVEHRKTDSPYIKIKGGGVYGQIIIIPTKYIDNFFEWVNEHCPIGYPHDDVAVGEFANDNNIAVFSSIPAILQHLAPVNSTLKYNNKNKVSKVYFGKDEPKKQDWHNMNYSSTTIRNSASMAVNSRGRKQK